jgi:hypothetical protein
MQKVIFTTSFHCKFCDKDIPLPVVGDESSDFPANEGEVQEAKEWGEHFHWCDHHRRCAVCGDVVLGGENGGESLNLVFDDGSIELHPAYIAETLRREGGRQLLVVHRRCVPEES